MDADDLGSEAATIHLQSVVERWARSTGSVSGVQTLRAPLEGVLCSLHLNSGADIALEFVFTRGVESGDADDEIVNVLNEAWAVDGLAGADF